MIYKQTTMTKEEQIQAKLSAPILVSDEVDIQIEYEDTTNERVGKKYISKVITKVKSCTGRVIRILHDTELGLVYEVQSNESIVPSNKGLKLNIEKTISERGTYIDFVLADWVKPRTKHCGANPFKESPQIIFQNSQISSLLYKLNFSKENNFSEPIYKHCNEERDKVQPYYGKTYGGINFDPYVKDNEGNRQYFQRGYVWTLEQKQLLINSIYSGIEIGKFLFKYNSWEKLVEQMIEDGHGYDFECIDGKQRLSAIMDFVQNKFTDSYGNYFKDLSSNSQWMFVNYGNLATGTIDERATDKQVLNSFLYLNFTGVPMSKEHIDYVQSIKL